MDKYGYSFTLPAGTYTVSATKIGAGLLTGENPRYMYGYVKRVDGTTVTYSPVKHTAIEAQKITIQEGDLICLYNGYAKTNSNGNVTATNRMFLEEFDVQIEVGSTKTDYEPYQGDEFACGEAVPALQGVNSIWADVGEITVTGRKDHVAIIEKLTQAFLATGSNV